MRNALRVSVMPDEPAVGAGKSVAGWRGWPSLNQLVTGMTVADLAGRGAA